MQQKQLLTEKDIKSVEAVLSKGDRVEIIPVRDGVKVVKVRRLSLINTIMRHIHQLIITPSTGQLYRQKHTTLKLIVLRLKAQKTEKTWNIFLMLQSMNITPII